MTITAIGFANKFYTLWQISEETRPLGNGCSYLVTHYYYIKNISFDKETALAKYPNAILDENLRGKTASWESKKEVWNNVDTFRFGKYAYTKIAECSDTNYIAWYWNQVYTEHKEYVEEVLKNRGYEIRVNIYENYQGQKVANQYLMSPEDLENERKNNEKMNMILEKCKNNEMFEFVPEYNLDEEGDYRDEDIIFHFDNIKEMYYQGYSYYLPLDAKGKAKRFKNKNVKITKYTYETDNNVITINVKEFEIIK